MSSASRSTDAFPVLRKFRIPLIEDDGSIEAFRRKLLLEKAYRDLVEKEHLERVADTKEGTDA